METCGDGSLLPFLDWYRGWNSGHQACIIRRKSPLPPKQSGQPGSQVFYSRFKDLVHFLGLISGSLWASRTLWPCLRETCGRWREEGGEGKLGAR